MSDRNLDDLHPAIQGLCQDFLTHCQADGINAFITQTFRSPEEQDTDYAQGRTTPGPIITNAQAGQSKHNFTLADGTPAAKAFDFGIKNGDGALDWDAADPQWQKAIQIGRDLGLHSGADWHCMKDNPHMEID